MSDKISFRPTPAAELAIANLMDRWRCKRSQAINIALEDAVRSSVDKQAGTAEIPAYAKPKITVSDAEQTDELKPVIHANPKAVQTADSTGTIEVSKPGFKTDQSKLDKFARNLAQRGKK